MALIERTELLEEIPLGNTHLVYLLTLSIRRPLSYKAQGFKDF